MRKLVILITMFISEYCLAAPEAMIVTNRPVWTNAGWCSTGDANVLDSNGLGTDALWSYMNGRYGDGASTISTISNPRAIVCQAKDGIVRIRFRGSTTTTTGVCELWIVTGRDDAEYVADVNISLDTAPMSATMGGYYLDNFTNSGDTLSVASMRKFNYGNVHKMGVLQFDVRTASYVVIVFKQIENGIIYWDYCGY